MYLNSLRKWVWRFILGLIHFHTLTVHISLLDEWTIFSEGLKNFKAFRKITINETVTFSGLGLFPRLMSILLHGALCGPQAFLPNHPAAPFGLQAGWAVLLWEETWDRDGPASTHQPPLEGTSTHCHHLCRYKQVNTGLLSSLFSLLLKIVFVPFNRKKDYILNVIYLL